MKKRTFLLAALIAAFAALNNTTAMADIGYQFSTVGNPGNANDTTGFGGVSYMYSIGTYDVTLSQYATFLNAVAKTDTYGLYNTSMATDLTVAGISRTGSSGSYVYSVIGSGSRPVTYVSWFDAARMANWMNNGQPVGLQTAATTEQGAYTLNGITTGGLAISHNANATYWIPTENEWYKAAYYDPSLNGNTGGYWLYPTRSNSAPGNNANLPTIANQANTNSGTYSVTGSASYDPSQNYLTAVGTFTNSASAYGTYDQGGDVYQWNDAVVSGSNRELRGGAWLFNSVLLQATSQNSSDPSGESSVTGFRFASVPEPSTVVSLIAGFGILAWRRKRLF
jgi:formylglycine-generating enzyme required for sulfatase activity